MVWFYKKWGKITGPVSDMEMQSLVQQGRIRPDTPVWNEGIGRWLPYSEVRFGGDNSNHIHSSENSKEYWASEAPSDLAVTPVKDSRPQKAAKAMTGVEVSGSRAWACTLNISGIVASLWLWFSPYPHPLPILACAVVPAASILALKFHKVTAKLSLRFNKGKINGPLFAKKEFGLGVLSYAMLFPSFALEYRCGTYFHLLSYGEALLLAAVVGTFFATLFLVLTGPFNWVAAPIGILLGLAYGYGTIMGANCLLDRSAPRGYRAAVMSKSTYEHYSFYGITHSNYFITIAPWGPEDRAQEIGVTGGVFSHIKNYD